MIKIIKKSLVLFISIMMIFSTNALQSSSGDAFITKAEFDKALSDFDERLSTFEAGINSKIDSQVTSYLDRNGIWSPLRQVKNTSTCSHSCYSTWSKDTPGTEWAYGGNENFGGPYVYITKISKSGLMFGSYTWGNASGNNSLDAKFGWSGKMSTYSNWRSDLGLFFLVNIYEDYDSVRTKKYSSVLFTAVGSVEKPTGITSSSDPNFGNSFILACTLPSTPVENKFQFFVTKGSQILWEPQCIYHFGCSRVAYPLSPTNPDDSRINISMLDADVY